ncbi:MAG: hypothetical protein M3081_19995 [Gemmatimonadota bacterium]|nr:hypothetical protein [Gemmatimonadota bacterium]
MFIELIDRLRCVHEHALDWLVASTGELHGRDVTRGILGCPTCRAQYPIVRGIVDFARGSAPAPSTSPMTGTAEEEAMRVAALLDLSTPGGVVVLTGGWSALAPALAVVADGVQMLAINPVDGVASGDGVSIATAPAGVMPLRPGVARGIALDEAHVAAASQSVEALAASGRLLAPASMPVPAGVTELARDARLWVAERDAAPVGMTPIVRARPRG